MYRSEPLLQRLSLILLVFLVPHLLGFTVHQQSDARPLNPNMEEERRERQSFPNSTFEALVKKQSVANKGEIPVGGPPSMYYPPSHIGNHEMRAGQMVHGGEYVPLHEGPVPPSAPNPCTP
ncbi:hypothetical protein CMV_027201 [Castanea mollissima]|uniref:Uncharacterized protein n=1 Tax=Castanea mollissima TaxID=60419 RepID=A0A8J4VDG6_9ROSI|nr:hypothetical protein CMV_027201 [Castanea mollissima]